MEKKKCATVEIHPLHERGWLLQVSEEGSWPEQRRLLAMAEQLRAHPAVQEVVVGDGSLGLLLHEPDPEGHWPRQLRQTFAAVAHPEETGCLHRIPVVFDGPDLPEVAERCRLQPVELVEQLAAVEYRVWFTGFQPGFPYMRGLPGKLQLPRRTHPRERVPAGTLAMAGAFVAIYPFSSPGGWHLLGSTGVRLFDPDKQPPALLLPGDRVRLVPEAGA